MISICICTYNRSVSLERTLHSLTEQKRVDLDATEVLVVDNNCTDQTANVVEAFQERLPIRRVKESRQGLAHARNRGVAEFEVSFYYSLTTIYGFNPAGLPLIGMQSVVFRTTISLADEFCRTGVI